MKLLVTSLGVLALALFSCAKAQDTTSSFFGFHYELIQPNTFTPLAVNVTQASDGLHHRSIAETFGSNNEIGLKVESSKRQSDTIWIKDGSNWLQIYYNDKDVEFFGITKGWRAIGLGNTDMAGYFIPLNTGLFIQSKKDFEWYIAYAGYVRQQPMVYEVSYGFNVLNRGYPTPIRLNESGIEHSEGFKKGDSVSGDIIWLYRNLGNGEPSYDQYYYTEGNLFFSKGWKKIGEGDTDAGDHTITNTLIIQTRGAGGRVVMYPPVGFPKKQTRPILDQVSPPKPTVYTFITLDEWGDPYFNVAWEAVSPLIDYTTEIWDDFNREWWSLNTLTGDTGQVLSNWAGILGLQRGIGRVRATWHQMPKG